MLMFILETMVPWVEIEVVFAACVNVSDLPLTVQISRRQWTHLIPAGVPWKLPPA